VACWDRLGWLPFGIPRIGESVLSFAWRDPDGQPPAHRRVKSVAASAQLMEVHAEVLLFLLQLLLYSSLGELADEVMDRAVLQFVDGVADMRSYGIGILLGNLVAGRSVTCRTITSGSNSAAMNALYLPVSIGTRLSP
jgi:hypothetical protein